MLDNTARYVYEVYRRNSVSHAASALFVTQPAISAAIRKAEKDFGAPIFNRKTLPFTLTEEGKIYIAAVEKMLRLEDQASLQLQDLRESQGGTLRITACDPISFRLVPRLLVPFRQRYPNLNIQVLSCAADRAYERLEKDLTDVLLCPLPPDHESTSTIRLFDMRSIVVLPENAPISPALRKYAVSWDMIFNREQLKDKLITDRTLFQDVPFLHIPSIPYIFRRRTQLFDKFEVASGLSSNSSVHQLNYNLMREGFGALLITDVQLSMITPEPGCMFFALGGSDALQPYYMSYTNKRNPESFHPLRDFLETAQETFRCENPLSKILDP